MSFEVKDRAAAGRIGRFETPHGAVSTPTLLPVINPNLPTVPASEMRQRFGAQMVITNSYILRKNDDLREQALRDGVHKTIGWDGPVMTDSGTFQSYVYGSVDVKPLEIIDFQRRIGVDVGTILDVFTTPDAKHEQAASDLEETLARARASVEAKDGMLLAATVQGGVFTDLRAKAAQGVGALDVDLVPIGGVVPLMEQARYSELTRVILTAKRHLPSGKPVHLFGAGHPLVFPLAVALGCDLFDSASYAKYAKDGRMIFPNGTRQLAELDELACPCPECDRWRSASELLKAEPTEREAALARHNLHVSFSEIRRIRQAIRDGALWELVEERAAQNPALQDALHVLRAGPDVEWLESMEPLSGSRAFQYRGPHSLHRPIVERLQHRILERWRPRSKVCHVLPEREKPYAESYAPYLDAFLRSGQDFVVSTPFGPVPLEYDRLWPVAQSVFPRLLDAEGKQVRDAYAVAFHEFFEGCDVLPFEPSEWDVRGEGASADAWQGFDERRMAAVAAFQFGEGAAEALLGPGLELRRSAATGVVRNILRRGEHVASVRATDGLLTLRAPGARLLRQGIAAPRLRIQLEDEPAQFAAQGRNVMAKFVVGVDRRLRPGDDALVVNSRDECVAVARCLLSGPEMREFSRGIAAKNMEHASD